MITLTYVLCALVYPNVVKCSKPIVNTRERATIEQCHYYVKHTLTPRVEAVRSRRIKWYRCTRSTPAEVIRHHQIKCRMKPNSCSSSSL